VFHDVITDYELNDDRYRANGNAPYSFSPSKPSGFTKSLPFS
jgi:hypothetical protein